MPAASSSVGSQQLQKVLLKRSAAALWPLALVLRPCWPTARPCLLSPAICLLLCPGTSCRGQVVTHKCCKRPAGCCWQPAVEGSAAGPAGFQLCLQGSQHLRRGPHGAQEHPCSSNTRRSICRPTVRGGVSADGSGGGGQQRLYCLAGQNIAAQVRI